MKIVKKGQLPDNTLTGECGHCRCRVEALPTDTDVQAQGDGRNGTDYYCLCPTEGCKERIWLSPKKPPKESPHWDDPRY
jgi:hypothetical protein